jgi:hypothetical protein
MPRRPLACQVELLPPGPRDKALGARKAPSRRAEASARLKGHLSFSSAGQLTMTVIRSVASSSVEI